MRHKQLVGFLRSNIWVPKMMDTNFFSLISAPVHRPFFELGRCLPTQGGVDRVCGYKLAKDWSSYFTFFTSPFFTPASGKIHIATTINMAVTMM